jgi:hypothetical protein
MPPDDGLQPFEVDPPEPDEIAEVERREGWAEEGEVIGKTAVPIEGSFSNSLVVGPDEVLVCVTPLILTHAEAEAHRQQMRVALGSDRFIILCGKWQIAKVAAGTRAALGPSLCNAAMNGQFGCKTPEQGRRVGDPHVCGLIGGPGHNTHRCAGCGLSWEN